VTHRNGPRFYQRSSDDIRAEAHTQHYDPRIRFLGSWEDFAVLFGYMALPFFDLNIFVWKKL
jgi:hypothetical protein